jgi:glycosyltransferase involved in cell wall biosynthesis
MSTVVLDCRWLSWSGAGRVTEQLLVGLGELRPPHRWILWGPEAVSAYVWPGSEWVPAGDDPTALSGQRDWFRVPKGDLVVFMHQQRPLRKVRSVTMILDTQPVRHNAGGIDALAKRWFLRRVGRISDHVLTISKYAKQCIVDDLGVDPQRITTVRLPVDAAMAARVLERRRRGTRQEVAVYVGLFLAHKNLPRLIEAFGRTAFRARGGRLVLIGGKGLAAGLEASLDEDQRSFVQVVPYATQAELERWYAEATLLVQPSLEEGYGLPVAEALSAGLEVCAADAGALPEAARGMAEMFDPASVESIAAAIDRTATRAAATTDGGRSLAERYVQGAAKARDLAELVLSVVEGRLP